MHGLHQELNVSVPNAVRSHYYSKLVLAYSVYAFPYASCGLRVAENDVEEGNGATSGKIFLRLLVGVAFLLEVDAVLNVPTEEALEGTSNDFCLYDASDPGEVAVSVDVS